MCSTECVSSFQLIAGKFITETWCNENASYLPKGGTTMMEPILVRPTGKTVECRCGNGCASRTLHKILVYDFEEEKYLALECAICSTIVLTFIPYPGADKGATC